MNAPSWSWDPERRKLRVDRLPIVNDQEGLGWATYNERGRRLAHGTDRWTRPSAAALAWADELAEAIAQRGGFPDETLYLRYGRLPPNGISINHATGRREAGVSVYAAKWEPVSGRWVLDGAAEFGAALFAAAQGRPVYLVSGEEVGIGSDGEPVLQDARVVARMTYDTGGYVPQRPRRRR